MKKAISLLLALTLGLLSGCAAEDDPAASAPVIEFEAQTWTVSFSGTEDSVEGQAAQYFADAVYGATNGAVTVELCPEDSLTDGDAGAGLRAVADGGASIGLYNSLVCEKLDPRLGVVSLPFLFSSAEDAAAKLDGDAGAALGEILREYGLQSLGIGEAGFRFPTNSLHPIAAPIDMTGLKLRVVDSELIQEAYRIWGADCASADWPMVFTALCTGTYKGQEAFLSMADAASIQSVQSYLTKWSGIYCCLYFCVNEELYDGLSPELREVADRCGREAVARQRELARQEEAEILRRWAKAKVAIRELTPEEAAAFRQAAQPCYDKFSSAHPDLCSFFL